MKIRKKIWNRKTVWGFTFLTMLFSIIYVVVRICLAPQTAAAGSVGVRVKSDYTLMLLQCAAGTLALLLPSFIERRLQIVIPSAMIIVYAVFLYCAIYLGEVRNFYFQVPHWDTILHTFSGVMLGALGFTLISFLNKSDKIPVSLSPAFIALFTFCFAVSLGIIWEIYEYAVDYLFHTNMQKFALEDGAQLVGQAALSDTMKDIIVDCIGALVFAVFGFISLKQNKSWTRKMVLKKRSPAAAGNAEN